MRLWYQIPVDETHVFRSHALVFFTDGLLLRIRITRDDRPGELLGSELAPWSERETCIPDGLEMRRAIDSIEHKIRELR